MKLSLTRTFFLALFFITAGLQTFAQGKQGYTYASVKVNPSVNASYPNTAVTVTDNNSEELKVLTDLENSFNKKPSRKLLLQFLREVNHNSAVAANQRNSKLNLHLANLFARLRLYPLVMKCYFKNNVPGDDVYRKGYFIKQGNSDSIKMANDSLDNAGLLSINSRDSLLLKTDSGFYNHDGKNLKSALVESADIINPFEDGKTGVKFALLVHIQQPKSGKPKIFIRLNKVGHTFITLIKYNADSTYVARTFGFYPDKESLLSATPIFPSADPVFKNDEKHDWDEVVGKFISKRRFQKILQLVKQYNSQPYNLNTRNCTDFGLDAATIGGINILGTYGKWPLGHGNNPATTGMSLLEGKVVNSDTEDGGLFIYNDLLEDK